MHKISLAASLVSILFSLILAYLFLLRSPSIVYVDSARLINRYEGMIKARSEYQKKTSVWRSNIDTLTAELKNEIIAYDKSVTKMSAKEKELTKELIRSKQKRLVDYEQAIKSQAEQEDAKLTESVLGQINSYIKEFGEKNGYTIVLAATEFGNVAYADKQLDITDEILAHLNGEFTKNQ